MYTNCLKPAKLLLVDENGNQSELNGTIEFNEIDTTSSNECDPYKDVSITELGMTINITDAKKLTRKKFVQLLMSKGIGRNGANEIAKHVLKKNGKYTMFDLLLW